jgi:hypothetical protein
MERFVRQDDGQLEAALAMQFDLDSKQQGGWRSEETQASGANVN